MTPPLSDSAHQRTIDDHRTQLQEVRQRFTASCSRMEALVAERQRQGCPLSSQALADFRALKQRFDQHHASALQSLATMQDSQRENIKTARDDVESKYKAADQTVQSDYQVLLSIVKTLKDKLDVANKGLGC